MPVTPRPRMNSCRSFMRNRGVAAANPGIRWRLREHRSARGPHRDDGECHGPFAFGSRRTVV